VTLGVVSNGQATALLTGALSDLELLAQAQEDG
jgi:hypothetical protein